MKSAMLALVATFFLMAGWIAVVVGSYQLAEHYQLSRDEQLWFVVGSVIAYIGLLSGSWVFWSRWFKS